MDRYFNRKRIDGANRGLVACYVLAGIILLPLIVILIAGLQDGESHMIVTVVILLLILSAEVTALALITHRINRAKRYAPIFEEDHDGIITFERINEMTGYGLEKVKKDVTWLLKSGYLINAVTDDEKVILWSESEYLDITCPTCGAVNSVRVGSSNKCKHCGSYLRRV